MSDKKELEKPIENDDPELDELLDSALEDLIKNPNETKKKSEESVGEKSTTDQTSTDDKLWSDEFIKQAASQFESNMASLLGSVPGNEGIEITPEQIQQNLQRMAEAAAQVVSGNTQSADNSEQSNDFAATITETIQGLSSGAENLQNPFSEQDLINMFGNLSGGGNEDAGAADSNAFLPFMQDMMQNLLSKEVLYPSLKDILDRYPTWLDENKEKLEPNEYERYVKQKDLMKAVCDELEKEQESDSSSVKRERFDKVLTLMQKMQDLGHPPTDLVGDAGPGFQFDPQGNLMMPDPSKMNIDPNQCTLM